MTQIRYSKMFTFKELHDKLFIQPEQPEGLIKKKTKNSSADTACLSSRDSYITTTELEGEMCPFPERSKANRQHDLNSQENQGKPFQCMSALRHPLSMQNRHHFHV